MENGSKDPLKRWPSWVQPRTVGLNDWPFHKRTRWQGIFSGKIRDVVDFDDLVLYDSGQDLGYRRSGYTNVPGYYSQGRPIGLHQIDRQLSPDP